MADLSDPKTDIYRKLQRHLDSQPIGFPSTPDRSDIRVLKHIFSPKEALLATCLSHRARSLDDIFKRVDKSSVASREDLEKVLEQSVAKGGIESGTENGEKWYRNAPLVVGMYEYQLGRLNPEFIKDFNDYTSHRKFGVNFLSAKLPQMRTIPIEKSIQVRTQAAAFDSIRDLLEASKGPFAICECICRKKQAMQGNTCTVTDRKETCLAVGHLAQTAAKIGMGRAVSLEDTLSILEKNQEEGLVLQPSNTRDIDFICSCCGCCCGMLRMHKKLPRPLDFWVANFFAAIDADVCTGCGLCAKKCQVEAISGRKKQDDFTVSQQRCIGCGNCVTVCPVEAISLIKKDQPARPPKTRDQLLDILESGKKGRIGQMALTGKLIKDALVTGRTKILKSD